MTPQQQVDAVLKMTPPGECPEIPAFLLVKNRKPLTKKQEAKLTKMPEQARPQDTDRVDYRKPKSTSWEDWDAHLARQEVTKAEKTAARVAEIKEKYGDRVKPTKPKKPTREELFAPDAVIKVLVEKNPCREGTGAHGVFKCYKTGMTVAQFEKAAAKACPGKLRPVDYLVYDSRKGRVSVEWKEKRSGKR